MIFAKITVFVLVAFLRVYATRRMVGEALEPNRAVQWFGFQRALGRMSSVFWTVWLALSWWLRPWTGAFLPLYHHFHSTSTFFAMRSMFANFMAVIAPALISIACDIIVFPAVQALRGLGVTRREQIVDAWFSRLWLTVGFTIFWTGFSVIHFWPVLAPGYSLLAALWLILLPRIWVRLRGSELFVPFSLTHGPLRDRAFAMAEKAGVDLKQIYVYPLEKWKLGNAWASQQNTLLLTDMLLKQLNIREVDAIVGHEIAHMRDKHPMKLGWILMLFILPLGFGLQRTLLHLPRIETGALTIFLGWKLFGAVRGLFSRRYEFRADAGGVALNGDPAAFISAMGKIHRMNAVPLEFERLEERFSTHPSTRRRMEAVARNANIGKEEIDALVNDGLDDPARYDLPTGLVVEKAEAALVFTSRLKQKAQRSAQAWLYLTIIFPPLALLIAATIGRPDWVWLALAIFVPLYFWIIAEMTNRAGTAFIVKLRPKLEQKLKPPREAVFVGLSPHGEVRTYEGNYIWDLGFLTFENDRLKFVGEQATFELAQSQIIETTKVAGAPRWCRTSALLIKTTTGALRFYCPEKTLSKSMGNTDELCAKVNAWLEAKGPGKALNLSLVLPKVTSADPFRKWHGNLILNLIIIVAPAIGVVFGSELIWTRPGLAAALIALPAIGLNFAFVPVWRRRKSG
jgi:Zn-dependent protease with chaperone function